MPGYNGPQADLSDLELDLFVTGTDMRGLVYTVLDDQGHAIDVKDQRAVFWLKHRPYGTQFVRTEDTAQALAKLCRLTSCFPAAFAPVLVSKDKPGGDALLQTWGQLNRDAYFLDGGVLANKPFSHTLQAICARPVTRPVERVLCYVEPDPEHFPKSGDDGTGPAATAAKPEDPSFFAATFEGAFSIPTYQSIAEDLKRISEHNAQVDRYRQVCRDLQGRLGDLFRDGKLPLAPTFPKICATQSAPLTRVAAWLRSECVPSAALRATRAGQHSSMRSRKSRPRIWFRI
jgi:patatin-related protein